MFHDLHVEHDIESFPGLGQRLGGGVAVIHLQRRLLCMDTGHRNVPFGGVRADDVRAQPRQGF